MYDGLSGRWFLSVLRTDTTEAYLAVSDGSSPSGGSAIYSFGLGSQYCPDQPRLGASSGVVALSFSLFEGKGCHQEGNATLFGGELLIVNKAEMIAQHQTLDFQTLGPDLAYDNYQPAVELQPSAQELFASAQIPTANVIHLVHFTGEPPNAVVTATNTVLVTPLYTPPAAVQKGTGVRIDTGDNRIASAVLLNGVLYLSANDLCLSANGSNQACGRVMEIDTVHSSLIGETDLGFNGGDQFYTALAPDGLGNLLAVFDYSSPHDYPSIGTVAALGPILGEDGGNFTGEVTLASGSAPNTSGRYGDYSGAAIDSTNPADVWVGSQVGDDLGVDTKSWGSHVDAISLSANTVPLAGVHQIANPGGTYRGKTRQRYGISLYIGGGGGRVERVRLGGITLQCRHHYHDRLSLTVVQSPASLISSAGQFRIVEQLGPDRFARTAVVTVMGVSVNGRFSGTVETHEASRHHGNCRSGRIAYTAT